MADKLVRRRSRGEAEAACEVGSAHTGDRRHLGNGEFGIEVAADKFHHTRQSARVQGPVCASRRSLANVGGGVLVDEVRRERESKRLHQKATGRAFVIEFLKNLARDLINEHILRDGFVTQLHAPRINIEVTQHRFLEWLAGEENVQTILKRLGDVDEFFRDAGRAEPYGARLAMRHLTHPAADAINQAMSVQEDGNLGITRRQRR